jgi:hypothetical protein
LNTPRFSPNTGVAYFPSRLYYSLLEVKNVLSKIEPA